MKTYSQKFLVITLCVLAVAVIIFLALKRLTNSSQLSASNIDVPSTTLPISSEDDNEAPAISPTDDNPPRRNPVDPIPTFSFNIEQCAYNDTVYYRVTEAFAYDTPTTLLDLKGNRTQCNYAWGGHTLPELCYVEMRCEDIYVPEGNNVGKTPIITQKGIEIGIAMMQR